MVNVSPTRVATTRPYSDWVAPAEMNNAPVAGTNGVLEIPARYQILSEIGRGGTGIVYKVHDLETDEVIALKVLKPEIAFDQVMRESLRQEVCLARRVTHRNVCRIHEFNRSNAVACVSMEFIQGESLFAKLQRVGALSVREAIIIARQICSGLREAHAQGIVHRDLKPANIMIDQNGNVKIMDFGIARFAQESNQMTRTMVGTPEYMSPEQVELKAVTPRTDIYSLGLVLYEMVTGSRAFSGETAIAVAVQHIRKAPKRPSEIVPALAPGVETVILKCLRKEPAKRFQSVDELDAALAQCAKRPKAKLEIEPLLRDIFKMSREAASQFVFLAEQFRRATEPALEQCGLFCRSQRFVTPARIKSAQVTAILGVTFLSTAATFGLVTAKRRHVGQPVGQSRSVRIASNTVFPVANTTNMAMATDQGRGATTITSRAEELSVESNDLAPSDAHPAANTSQSTVAAKMKKAKMHAQISTGPAAEPNAVSAAQLPFPLTDTHEMASLTAVPALDSSADSTSAKAADSPVNAKPSLAVSYLEVGSFKEAKWADNAVDQLTHLGFHTICIHKTHLWIQSYQVRVGPYDNANDIEAAAQRLAALGFKGHAVK